MKPGLKQSRGQATVEYLLLIMVVITLALSIGRPLGDYLTGLSGALLGPDDGYYACLMEQAELPGQTVSCGDPQISALTFPPDSGGEDPGDRGPGDKGPGDRGPGDRGPGSKGPGDKDPNQSSNDNSEGDGFNGSNAGDRDGSSQSDRDKSGKGKTGRARNSLSSRHRVDTGSDKLSGRSDSALGRARNQSSFLASLPSSSGSEVDEGEEGSGSLIRRRGRAKKKKSIGANFNTSEQEGYKQSRKRNNSEFIVGYLGERYEEEEEQESKKVFKSSAPVSFDSGGAGLQREDAKSSNQDSTLPNKGPKEPEEIKKMSFMKLIRYIILAVLIILVLAFLFSQAMEYQSRD